MITATQINAARDALLQMIRGMQMNLPIQILIEPTPTAERSKRLRRHRPKYVQLSLFGEPPPHD